jgi:hypothetical protein
MVLGGKLTPIHALPVGDMRQLYRLRTRRERALSETVDKAAAWLETGERP